MPQLLFVTLLLLVCFGCTQATDTPAQSAADNSQPVTETAAASQAQLPAADPLAQDRLEAYQQDTSDLQALVDFANANLREIIRLLDQSPEEAEQLIVGLRQSLEGLDTPNEEAQGLYLEIQDSLDAMADRLQVVRLPLEEIKAQVSENPNDSEAVKRFGSKLEYMAFRALEEDLDRAEKILVDEVSFITDNYQKATEQSAKLAYQQVGMTVQQLGDQIGRYKEYRKVVGKEMIPLEAEAWVHGQPLEMDELQGKVVLLDFWAVWCGPCLMTFPHLVEWQEEYGDQGFQIVGVTRYYNFAWPDDAEAPEQMDHPVSPEDEQKMLAKMSERFELKHPTAILPNSSDVFSYYAEMGLPHLVLVGRDGKVRRVEAGISDRLVAELDQQIQELLAEPAPESSGSDAEEGEPETSEPPQEENSPVAPEPVDNTEPADTEPTDSDPADREPATAEPSAEEETEPAAN